MTKTPIQINFGIHKTVSPKIFIEFATFNPDINVGGNRLGNLTTVDGVELFNSNTDPETVYNSLKFEWFSMGKPVSTLQNPQLKDLKNEDNGLILITCKVTFLPLG